MNGAEKDDQMNNNDKKINTFIITILTIFLFPFTSYGDTDLVDINKIKMIESSNCKHKFGQYEHARGCFQITQPALTDWNNSHKNEQYTLDQMLDDELCLKVASWYLNERIPQMLRAYKKPVNTDNVIISYNAGIKYVRFGLEIPSTTKSYLKKYREIEL